MKSFIISIGLTLLFITPMYLIVSHEIKVSKEIDKTIESIKLNDPTVTNVIFEKGTYYIIK